MTETAPQHFIAQKIAEDSSNGQSVLTRFPPEPNGYLHIGHSKAIVLNFAMAQAFQGHCNLRFDDTNPLKESQQYVDAIKEDIEWLGYQWHEGIKFTSSYFEQLFELACRLIKEGKAFVCELSPDEQREFRGTLTEVGKNSPYRDRPVEESLSLFISMKEGKQTAGSMVLRAKIDMGSPNMNMRDPILYRVMDAVHHQAGHWHIYPMYDFAHPLSDAIEGISHSLCSLEFEDHRPLYDWVVKETGVSGDRTPPQQIEFGRLNLAWTVTSKRKLKQLVDDGIVDGWDDPRMPTLAGLRRRGVPPEAIRQFCDSIGITKSDGVVDIAMLEHAIRNNLDADAPRAMCVINPLKVTITNASSDVDVALRLPGHPKREDLPERPMSFTQTLYIDQADFIEVAPNKKYRRLSLGAEVRLRGAYVIRCDEMIKDEQGQVIELLCSYDPDTLGKNPEGRKVKGVIHWASEAAIPCEVRQYDRLFTVESPDRSTDGKTFLDYINQESLVISKAALVEPSLLDAPCGVTWQFEREGYFCRDTNSKDALVFNQTITLRDTWSGKS